MKPHCFAILLAFTLFSPTFCEPEPAKVNINNVSREIFETASVLSDADPVPTQAPETTDLTPSGITIPEVATTIPSNIDPTTTPKPITSSSKPNDTTTTTVKPPTPASSTVTPPPSPKTTEAPPKSTETPTPLPTASPHSKGRQFDGPSFIGGIVLACGLTAIGFVAFKFYKARTERNYHTL